MLGMEWAEQPMPCVKVNGPFGVREGASPRVCGYLGAMVGARAGTVPGSLAGQSVVLQMTLTGKWNYLQCHTPLMETESEGKHKRKKSLWRTPLYVTGNLSLQSWNDHLEQHKSVAEVFKICTWNTGLIFLTLHACQSASLCRLTQHLQVRCDWSSA